ncbi:MAG: hypothetical protein LW694_08055 [Chitinophagaceae bacterium]|jgi:predicted esterase YcpF (UPF0227 family)|nr:hypothetical protein [Chitinophagaceae bacterium]
MKRNIVYIHGFRSDGHSEKARLMQESFPDCHVVSPTLSPIPSEAIQQLEDLLHSHLGDTLLVGTSLGGFYALYLSCKFNLACCAINPAWQAHKSLARKIGLHTRYGTDELYDFRESYLEDLERMHHFIKDSVKDASLLNIFLSNDDEELSFDGLDQFIPEYRLMIRMDHSGHRFSRFPEILVHLRDIINE